MCGELSSYSLLPRPGDIEPLVECWIQPGTCWTSLS